MVNQNQSAWVIASYDTRVVGAETFWDREKAVESKERYKRTHFWWRLPPNSKLRSWYTKLVESDVKPQKWKQLTLAVCPVILPIIIQ